ncbi:hypothetical protein CPC08DRAFT_526647 [Agrocybe pediades]|nr:hypothetical protein CPC08DRAFT_526647 [Agrocybe pediades]
MSDFYLPLIQEVTRCPTKIKPSPSLLCIAEFLERTKMIPSSLVHTDESSTLTRYLWMRYRLIVSSVKEIVWRYLKDAAAELPRHPMNHAAYNASVNSTLLCQFLFGAYTGIFSVTILTYRE